APGGQFGAGYHHADSHRSTGEAKEVPDGDLRPVRGRGAEVAGQAARGALSVPGGAAGRAGACGEVSERKGIAATYHDELLIDVTPTTFAVRSSTSTKSQVFLFRQRYLVVPARNSRLGRRPNICILALAWRMSSSVAFLPLPSTCSTSASVMPG